MIKKLEDWIIIDKISLSDLKKIKKQINLIIKKLQEINTDNLSTRGDSIQYNVEDSLDLKLLDLLKKIVIDKYDQVFETDDINLKLTNAWTVLAKKTGWHQLHQHNQNFSKHENAISVVLFLETPKKITKNYPGEFYYVYQKDNDSYIRYNSIIPNDGSIVLMPTWLWHGAYPSAGKRQTLNLEFYY
jgi:hypothetical protein